MNEKIFKKKSLGQNFLQDKNIINKIVEYANLDKDTTVIEIGPGGGALTKELVPLCGKAILYEMDNRLEKNLRLLLQKYDNYTLIIGDFLKANIKNDLATSLFEKLYVVANLPYYITTPIIMKFINDNVFPDKIVVMVQKEVATRFSAKVGSKEYGSLTVFLNYYYDVQKLFDVSKNCFSPRPSVDSAVVCMKLKKEKLYVRNIDFFKQFVKDSFSLKRKTIKNNLKNYNLKLVEQVLTRYGFDLSVRAEQLSLDIFVELANKLVDCKKEKLVK